MGYREPRIVGQGICPYCGDEFDKHDKRQKYCNPTCRGLYAEEHSPKKASYFKILARDGFKCLYCGRTPVEDGVKLCLDHLFPYVNGGRTDLNNLVTCCEECNQRKSELVMSKEVMDRFYGVINKRNEVFTMADYERISGHMLDYFQRSR